MPCNCSGVRLRKCSCKVFGYPLATSKTQNVVLVEQDSTTTNENEERLNFVISMFERFYERCAGYNLRYCPLRGKTIREKHLANVAKNVFIMMCFLFANSIVFLNIISRIGIHMYYVF